MSGELLTDSDLAHAARKPPSRWLNLYDVLDTVRFTDGRVWPPGKHWGDGWFESYDLAETHAIEFLAHPNIHGADPIGNHVRWIDAFPERHSA